MFYSKVRKKIYSLIEEGKSRQEVFEILWPQKSELNISERRLKNLIRHTPTLYSRIKYKLWHNILLGLILVLAILSVAFGLSLYLEHKFPVILILIFPMVEIIFLIQLLRYRGHAYFGIGLIIVLQITRNLEKFDFSSEVMPYTIGLLTIMLTTAGISFYLSSVMCSGMKEVRVEKIVNGQKKYFTEERFVDPIAKDEDPDIL